MSNPTHSEHAIIAVETDSAADCGFSVAFDRSYNLAEGFPISETAATRAVDDAWDWGYHPTDLDEGEQIGVLVTDNREYVRTYLTYDPEDTDE